MYRFITKKRIEVHDQSGSAENRYKPSKQIIFKTSMLRSDLCDYSDVYIVVKEDITVTGPNNNAHVDNAECLDIVMPMYNLIEYSKNYSKATESLWNYYRGKPKSGAKPNINYSIKDSKSFDYKTNITERLESNDTEKEVEIVVPLKH